MKITAFDNEWNYALVGGTANIGEGNGAPSSLDDLADVDAAAPADGDVLTWDDYTGSWIAADSGTVGIVFVIDGGTSALTTGVKLDLQIPFACTITEWSVLLDQSGSIVFDLWKDALANYPPTVADTITAAAKPTVSAATHASSSTLTGWTTWIIAGDTLRLNVDSVATATRATLTLFATRS